MACSSSRWLERVSIFISRGMILSSRPCGSVRAQFKGGTVGYRNVTTVVAPGMFFTTDIETYTSQRMAGVDRLTSWSNRVTHVFRLEDAEWRLVHRHANRIELQFEPASRLGAKDDRAD